MVPSACIGNDFAYFESVHGTAWDIAGKGVANPIASILSAGLMLRWLGEETKAWYVETAVKELLLEGKILTPDLGGQSSTSNVGNDIVKRVFEMESKGRELEDQCKHSLGGT
jgi:isocitrate/isopropylmalate dehydrogenase